MMSSFVILLICLSEKKVYIPLLLVWGLMYLRATIESRGVAVDHWRS